MASRADGPARPSPARPASAWRSLGVALAVGLAGGVALALLLPERDGSGGPGLPAATHGAEPPDWNATGWVFLEGPRVAAPSSNATLLHVGPPHPDIWREADCDVPDWVVARFPEGSAVRCYLPRREPGVTLLGTPAVSFATALDLAPCGRPPCEAADAPFAARDARPGPRLGEAGHNATALTLFAFDAEGLLLATNAPDADLARFALSGDFTRLPGGTWYLGANATAPPGTTRLPAAYRPLLDQARPLLAGLPEGGVATTHFRHWAVGDLWITARVDRLDDAP